MQIESETTVSDRFAVTLVRSCDYDGVRYWPGDEIVTDRKTRDWIVKNGFVEDSRRLAPPARIKFDEDRRKKKMKNNEVISGQFKKFIVEKEFELNGEVIKVGETLELTGEQARKLLTQRLGRMIGGPFSLESRFDGAHAITLWTKAYAETDDFVLVEFLEDCHGYSVKKGERRRFWRSDAIEMRHEYLDTHEGPRPAIPRPPALIRILEPRPRNTFLSAEEVAQRQKLVLEGVRREEGWMAQTFKD